MLSMDIGCAIIAAVVKNYAGLRLVRLCEYSMVHRQKDAVRLQLQIGIEFNDQSLLVRALTHRSYLNEQPVFVQADNERLEYLGDAILDFIIAEYLYHRLPEVREGQLTSLRAALVRRETLARAADRIQLGDYLYMGRGEIESGGRGRPGTLCAAFEALVGAIYLDRGMEVARNTVVALMAPDLAQLDKDDLVKDSKSQLQELTQGKLGVAPVYRTVEERGPDHAKEFTLEVAIGDVAYGQGVGHSKQVAAQEAATVALARLIGEYDTDQPAEASA